MLYVLLIISGLLSWFALRERISLLGLLAGGAWFVVMAYIAAYPPGELTQGDTIHGMLVLVLIGVAIAVPIITIRMARTKAYTFEAHYDASSEGVERGKILGRMTDRARQKSVRHGWGGSFAESEDEYKARVHSILHPKHRRR